MSNVHGVGVVHPDARLRLLIDGPAPGEANMRRDTRLLEACSRGEIAGAVRLYWFSPPALTLGRMQPMSDVDVDACRRDGIDVARRPSGGRAVLHEHEVTYAVICSLDDRAFGGTVLDSCARIHAAVAAGLRLLGVTTQSHVAAASEGRRPPVNPDCFSRPAAAELLDEHGRKLVGSAQARRGQTLLQHGSVLLEPSRAGRYLRSTSGLPSSIGLRGLTGRSVAREEVCRALALAFRQSLGPRLADPLDTTS